MDILSDKRISDSLKATTKPRKLAKTMSNLGVNVLGYGMEAVAIEQDGRVFKIIPRHSEGHTQFLELIPLIDSVHLPVIYNVSKVGPVAVVEMEKLNSIDLEEYYDIEVEEFDTVKELLREAASDSICFDMHSGNVMQRDDGTYVITDPFY